MFSTYAGLRAVSPAADAIAQPAFLEETEIDNIPENVPASHSGVGAFGLERERLRRLVHSRFSHKAYCFVEQWTLLRAALNDEEHDKVRSAGHLPLFLFANKVIEDSRLRFQPGDWVRSSMCLTFDGVMFETRNTVYVLLGPGDEQTASLSVIFSFF